MDNQEVKKYFSEKASFWLSEGYQDNPYTYPTGFHRKRIVLDIIKNRFPTQSINLLDIGCGGGDLCASAVQLGHHTTGLDQSEEMLAEANKKRSSLPPEIASRLNFIKLNFIEDRLPSEKYDIITALGFIGYLDNDDILFTKARELLKPDGFLIISCRNKLFDMTSINHYTLRDIKDGSIVELIKEIKELYHPLPPDRTSEFIKNLQQNINQISQQLEKTETETLSSSPTENQPIKFADLTTIDPRQHTPKQLTLAAQKNGFTNLQYYGVNPHLLLPKLNYLLPPRVFNQLSDSLLAFEKLPISLIWSSCFIGVFEKKL